MPIFREEKILPNSASQVFDLVMDIEKYPQFLPWCKQAKVIEQVAPDNLLADLLISFKAFTEKYRSDVKFFCNEEGCVVETTAISGPFKHLYSKWQIMPIDDNICQVNYFIDFSFSSKILEKMVGLVFEKAAQKMVRCFEERLAEIYN